MQCNDLCLVSVHECICMSCMHRILVTVSLSVFCFFVVHMLPVNQF